MGERAARWFRVSSDGQDEENQVSEVDAHIAARGYEAARTFRLHDISASKGEQQAALDAALADITAGRYSVIVVAHSSRLDRRDVDVQQLYALQVRAAGGRIESAREPQFGTTDIGGRVLTLLAQDANHQYSRAISGHTRAGKARIAANGALDGRPVFGYASEGERYSRRMVPTELGCRVIPEVYRRVAVGTPLDAVAQYLTDATGRPWYARTVAGLIRNPSYRGARQDAKGRTVHQCPSLVDGDLWRRATANLDARPSTRRGMRTDVDAKPSSLLSGLVTCYACGAPMYKIMPRDGRPRYRCAGHASQRVKGCGVMLPLAELDGLMDRAMSGLGRPVTRLVTHPASDHQAELDDVAMALRELPLQDLSEDDEDARRAELRAERKRLEALPRTAAWTERVAVEDEDGQPLTYGRKWQRSDAAERRAWLRSAGFAVYAGKPGMLDCADEDEALSRWDVWTGETAALAFAWEGDEDPGLARGQVA
jgi:DNA invertase Pin-like site-specific DNA recombinase